MIKGPLIQSHNNNCLIPDNQMAGKPSNFKCSNFTTYPLTDIKDHSLIPQEVAIPHTLSPFISIGRQAKETSVRLLRGKKEISNQQLHQKW